MLSWYELVGWGLRSEFRAQHIALAAENEPIEFLNESDLFGQLGAERLVVRTEHVRRDRVAPAAAFFPFQE